jgi:hypothetical protein
MTEVKSESSVFDALANKVSSYMAGKHLSVTGFSREAGVDRGVVFRLVRD